MLERWRLTDGRIVSDTATGNIFLYVSPDESERRFLIDAMRIDEHTLASSLDPDELARLEFEPDHVAIILKRPRNYSSADAFVFGVTSVGLFLFADRLVIVASEDGLLFQGKRFSKIVSLRDMVLKLVDHSIAHFLEHLRVINAVSDSLEDQINTSMQNKYLLNLFSLEKSLVYYLNAINSNGKLIERLRNNLAKLGFTPENVEYLDDMAIENTQCYEQAEIYSNILASMMDARASIVNNNLNWLMKTLTLITLGVMLPSLVVSIFSMNVKFPGMDHPWTFWIVLVLAAVSAMSVWVMGWLRKW
ncbi:MAG: magnesium transporter CorA family protein [Planctomycetaceae bacterium]|nr:magnesium transporter CorA family protein [Planctomycetaceae bacterium]